MAKTSLVIQILQGPVQEQALLGASQLMLLTLKCLSSIIVGIPQVDKHPATMAFFPDALQALKALVINEWGGNPQPKVKKC